MFRRLANVLLNGLHNLEKDQQKNAVLLQTSVKKVQVADYSLQSGKLNGSMSVYLCECLFACNHKGLTIIHFVKCKTTASWVPLECPLTSYNNTC